MTNIMYNLPKKLLIKNIAGGLVGSFVLLVPK